MAQSPDVSFTKLSKSIWVTSGAPTGFAHDCHVTYIQYIRLASRLLTRQNKKSESSRDFPIISPRSACIHSKRARPLEVSQPDILSNRVVMPSGTRTFQ